MHILRGVISKLKSAFEVVRSWLVWKPEKMNTSCVLIPRLIAPSSMHILRSVISTLKSAFEVVRTKLDKEALPNIEAEVWKKIISALAVDSDNQSEGSSHTRTKPFARNLGVNEGVQKDGYDFTTVYVFAPEWTTPNRNNMLCKAKFNDKVALRFIHYPGEGQGSLLANQNIL